MTAAPAQPPASDFASRYGPWAIVTGASSGIGMEFARQLAARRLNLVLVARREPQLAALARELTAAHGISAQVLAIDLAESASTQAVVAATAGLDVGLLVCSAGFGSSGSFISNDIEQEAAMVDLNCRSLLTLTWHIANRLVPKHRGGIVLLSSLVGFQGAPGSANYAATKAYVQSLAEALHHELKPHGVDVLASAPGPIHSGFAARAGMTMGKAQQPQDVATATLNALGRRSTVRPGWLSKVLAYSLAPLPRWARVRVMGKVMAGMARRSNTANA